MADTPTGSYNVYNEPAAAGPPWYDYSEYAHLVEEHPAAVRAVVYTGGVVSALIAARTVMGHLLNYTRPAVQRHIVRIQLLIPIYGLGSMLSLHVREDAIYVDTVRDIYEAFVIYSFLQLVLAYLGGEDSCARKMETLDAMPHPPPLCCLEPVKLNGAFLRDCKRGAIQFVVIKPFMAAVSLCMLWGGWFETATYQVILFVIYNITYAVALYALFYFVWANYSSLAPYKPVWKYFATKSVILWTWYQTVLIGMVLTRDIELASVWQDVLLSSELVIFALMHAFAFHPAEFTEEDHGVARRRRGCCETFCAVFNNLCEALSFSDICSDTVHNFTDRYVGYAGLQNEARDHDDAWSGDLQEDLDQLGEP